MIGERKTASCELNQRSANKPFLVGDTREKLFRYDFELSESAQKMCLYSKPDLAQLGSPMIVFGSMHQPTDYTNQALVECGRPHSLWNCLLMAHTSQHLTFPSTLYSIPYQTTLSSPLYPKLHEMLDSEFHENVNAFPSGSRETKPRGRCRFELGQFLQNFDVNSQPTGSSLM